MAPAQPLTRPEPQWRSSSPGVRHSRSSLLAPRSLLPTGQVKSIAVSNFSVKNLEILLKTATVVPAVNQVRSFPSSSRALLTSLAGSSSPLPPQYLSSLLLHRQQNSPDCLLPYVQPHCPPHDLTRLAALGQYQSPIFKDPTVRSTSLPSSQSNHDRRSSPSPTHTRSFRARSCSVGRFSEATGVLFPSLSTRSGCQRISRCVHFASLQGRG